MAAPIRCKLRGRAMALEFALRPRIDLERPAPQRVRVRLRLPKLTLPIVGYWLAMAGGTHVLLGVLEEGPRKGAAPTPLRARTAAPPVSPVSPAEEEHIVRELAIESARPPAPSTPAKAVSATSEPGFEFPPIPRAARSDKPAPGRREAQPPTATAETRDLVRETLPPPARDLTRETLPPPARDLTRETLPAVALPSCESAAAAGNQSIDLRAPGGAPDLTRDAFAAVLENGAYLGACAVPARTALEICAAVRDGKVVGLTVTSAPHDPALGACVRRAVAALHFPRSTSLDVTRTRFEATAR